MVILSWSYFPQTQLKTQRNSINALVISTMHLSSLRQILDLPCQDMYTDDRQQETLSKLYLNLHLCYACCLVCAGSYFVDIEASCMLAFLSRLTLPQIQAGARYPISLSPDPLSACHPHCGVLARTAQDHQDVRATVCRIDSRRAGPFVASVSQ